MDFTLIITLVGTAAAIIASNIALISWIRTDMRNFETEIRGWKEDMQKESKDFHGKLERHDAEYKAHLMHYHSKET